jgi:hypothetical protein
MHTKKRYSQARGLVLARRLLSALDAPPERARRVLVALTEARLGDVVINTRAVHDIEQATEAQLEKWQQILKATLAWIFRARQGGWRLVSTTTGQVEVSEPTFSGNLRVTLSADAPFTISGPAEMLLVAQLYLLERLVQPRLRRCVCGRLFVRIRKRQFCSTRCQQRIYMRKWRAANE